MEFYEAVKRRRTIREFADKAVPDEAVRRALAAGLKEFLGMPTGFEIAAVIPFGYPKDPPGENEDQDLEARLHVDGWGNWI